MQLRTSTNDTVRIYQDIEDVEDVETPGNTSTRPFVGLPSMLGLWLPRLVTLLVFSYGILEVGLSTAGYHNDAVLYTEQDITLTPLAQDSDLDLDLDLTLEDETVLIMGFSHAHANVLQEWLVNTHNFTAVSLPETKTGCALQTCRWELIPEDWQDRTQLVPFHLAATPDFPILAHEVFAIRPKSSVIFIIRDPIVKFMEEFKQLQKKLSIANKLLLKSLFPDSGTVCKIDDPSTPGHIKQICTKGLYINTIRQFGEVYTYGEDLIVLTMSDLFFDPTYDFARLHRLLGFKADMVMPPLPDTAPNAHRVENFLRVDWENQLQLYYAKPNAELCEYLTEVGEECPWWTTYEPRVESLRLTVKHPPLATAAVMDMIPQHLVLGFQKCGTSSMEDWLGAFPEVQMYNHETTFFEDSCMVNLTECSYEKWAIELETHRLEAKHPRPPKSRALGGLVMAKRPNPFPDRARVVYTLVPDARILLIIREPVSRLLSRYNMMVRRDILGTGYFIRVEPWEEFIPEDKTRSLCGGRESLCGLGQYVAHLRRLDEYFPLDSAMMLLTLEDQVSNPDWDLSVVPKFFGLSTDVIPPIPHSLKTTDEFPVVKYTEKQQERMQQYYEPYNLELCGWLKARDHRCPSWIVYPDPVWYTEPDITMIIP